MAKVPSRLLILLALAFALFPSVHASCSLPSAIAAPFEAFITSVENKLKTLPSSEAKRRVDAVFHQLQSIRSKNPCMIDSTLKRLSMFSSGVVLPENLTEIIKKFPSEAKVITVDLSGMAKFVWERGEGGVTGPLWRHPVTVTPLEVAASNGSSVSKLNVLLENGIDGTHHRNAFETFGLGSKDAFGLKEIPNYYKKGETLTTYIRLIGATKDVTTGKYAFTFVASSDQATDDKVAAALPVSLRSGPDSVAWIPASASCSKAPDYAFGLAIYINPCNAWIGDPNSTTTPKGVKCPRPISNMVSSTPVSFEMDYKGDSNNTVYSSFDTLEQYKITSTSFQDYKAESGLIFQVQSDLSYMRDISPYYTYISECPQDGKPIAWTQGNKTYSCGNVTNAYTRANFTINTNMPQKSCILIPGKKYYLNIVPKDGKQTGFTVGFKD